MAIARDNSGKINYTGSTTSISTSYTCTGSNLLLVAFLGFNGVTAPTLGATYNGVAMSKVGSVGFVGSGSTRGFQAFILVAPATGSNTIAFSSSATCGMEALFASYTGCAQTGQPDNNNQTTGSTGTSISSSITINTASSWLAAVGLNDNTSGEGTGTGVLTSLIYNTITGTTMGDSNGTLTTGSKSYGFSFPGGSGNTGLIGVSIAPTSTIHSTTLTESITNTDTLLRTTTRAFSEAITNTATAVKTAGRTLIEALTNTDAISKGPGRTFSEVSASGPLGPNSVVDDSSIGTVAWSSPTNAEIADGICATANLLGLDPASQNSIKLVKGGTIQGTDKSTGAIYHGATLTNVSFGGATDLWGLTLAPSDINASDFGVAISAKGHGPTISHYLKATNFGFNIPSDATVQGIVVTSLQAYSGGNGQVANIDYVSITVYYTGGITNTDTFAAVDTSGINATEAIALADTFLRSTTRLFTEAIANTDILVKTASRFLAETITNNDTFTFLRTRAASLSEAITNNDTFVKTITRTFAEIISLSPATNYIRNNTMQGVAAGTPGTNPTNWQYTTYSGITKQIIGSGTENGIDYVDIQWSGTAGSTITNSFLIKPESNTQVAALSGQIWDQSMFIKLVGGSLANVAFTLAIQEYSSGSTLLAQSLSSAVTPTSAGLDTQRYSMSRTLTNASTAFVNSPLFVSWSSGAAINFTLRIGWPQLELSSVPTNPIPTSGSAVSVGGDVLTALRVLPLNLSDAISLVDTIVKTTTKMLTQAISTTDTFIRSTARTLTQAITNTDTFSGSRQRIASLSDMIATADSVLRTTTRTLVEAISNSDTLATVKHFVRTYSEAITNTPSFLRSITISCVEAISNSDTFSRVVSYARIFAETMSLTDTLRNLLNGSTVIWHNLRTKASTVWDNASKAATAWTEKSKAATNWTNKNKSS